MLRIRSATASMIFVGAAALITPAMVQANHHEEHAVADIVDGQGQTKGRATLMQHKDGIHVEVKAVGLPAGVHAVHVHMTGTCTGPDFTSAGGHWNPGKKQHGHDNPAGAHMGDMPNMTVGADGAGTLHSLIKGAMLKAQFLGQRSHLGGVAPRQNGLETPLLGLAGDQFAGIAVCPVDQPVHDAHFRMF